MVAAAFVSLSMSRQLTPFVFGLFIVLGTVSYLFDPKSGSILWHRYWSQSLNGITFMLFGWSILDAFRGEPLAAGARFLCFFMLNKLWNRRTSSDYLQIYVLSFLMLVAGAALSSNLWYALCFLAYVVFTTWTLTLFHLRREMEDNYLLKHSAGEAERVGVERILNSRRVVGGSFLASTTLVSLFVFFGSVIAFLLVPRIGLGFFFERSRPQSSVVGFSEHVELGEYGVVKNNPQVVMRVEFDHGQPDHPLRFRGVSFDHYQSGHWSRTVAQKPIVMRRDHAKSLVEGYGQPSLTSGEQAARFDRALVQHVYLDPIDSAVLFGAISPIAFSLDRSPGPSAMLIDLQARTAGEVYAAEKRISATGQISATERHTGLKYTVYSDERLPNRELLDSAPVSDTVPLDVRPYLQLPTGLPQRVIDLAKKVTASRVSAFAKAMALDNYLRNTYRYTLDLRPDPHYEPIEDFLFVQKAGHCEYFASSMAVMLRAIGIPSRSINGFAGGEWNEYGKYLAVRQGDAHTWIEAWIAGVGWVPFDPTPVSDAAQHSPSALDKMRQLMDTFEMTWFKYVIEYDLQKQVNIVSAARDMAKSSEKSKLPSFDGHKTFWSRVALVLFALAGIYFLRRWRRFAPVAGVPAVRAYEAMGRALHALEKRGLGRRASETSRELAARVIASQDPGARPFEELVALYYEARYSERTVPNKQLDQLAEAVIRPPAPPPAPPA